MIYTQTTRLIRKSFGASSRQAGLLLFGVAVLLLCTGCQKKNTSSSLLEIPSAKANNTRKKAKKADIPKAPARSEKAEPTRRVFVGSLQSNRKVMVSPEVGGTIRKIYVKKGDFVKKKQKLLWIDCRDYSLMVSQVRGQIAVAKAGLNLAKMQAKNAHNEYRRFRGLYRKRSIPGHQWDKIKMGKALANAQVVLAQKRLQVAKVGLAMSLKRRSGCSSRAPFAGVVSNRMMDEGAVARAMPPSMVMVIEEITPIILEVPIGEMYLRRLNQIDSIEVIVPSLGKTAVHTLTKKELMKGLMPTINPYNRSATLRLSLPNKDRKLKPGMSAELHLITQAQ